MCHTNYYPESPSVSDSTVTQHEYTLMVGLIKLFKSVFALLTSRNCCHGHNPEEMSPEGADRKTPRGHPVSPSQTGHKGDSDTSFLHKTFSLFT